MQWSNGHNMRVSLSWFLLRSSDWPGVHLPPGKHTKNYRKSRQRVEPVQGGMKFPTVMGAPLVIIHRFIHHAAIFRGTTMTMEKCIDEA